MYFRIEWILLFVSNDKMPILLEYKNEQSWFYLVSKTSTHPRKIRIETFILKKTIKHENMKVEKIRFKLSELFFSIYKKRLFCPIPNIFKKTCPC